MRKNFMLVGCDFFELTVVLCHWEFGKIREWDGSLTPGSLTPQSPHFGAVPRFLMCSNRSFPPGVLITRTLFEVVLYL